MGRESLTTVLCRRPARGWTATNDAAKHKRTTTRVVGAIGPSSYVFLAATAVVFVVFFFFVLVLVFVSLSAPGPSFTHLVGNRRFPNAERRARRTITIAYYRRDETISRRSGHVASEKRPNTARRENGENKFKKDKKKTPPITRDTLSIYY